MKVAILYYNFLNSIGTERKIGGVQTYLWNLAKLIHERGDESVLLQPAEIKFEKQIEHVKIIGVPPNPRRLRMNICKDLYEYAWTLIDPQQDILIFGSDTASVRTRYPRAVSIQHGVCWDLPGRFLRNNRFWKIPWIPDWVCKKYITFRSYLYFVNCPYRVCVDYNFLNWYRTQIGDTPQGKTWVIPNFVEIPTDYQPDLNRHHRKPVRILFARRFVEFRGTRLMMEAARQILKEFPDVEFGFAGEGPDQPMIAEAFENEPRVSIRRYLPDESLAFHGKYQIAVVPSLASEGTSLSLAEAMAAGCAAVASNIGGMTNMILDGYNGRLIDPDAESLIRVLTELIPDPDRRRKLGERAAETAREAFSIERWKSRWSEVLNQIREFPLSSKERH